MPASQIANAYWGLPDDSRPCDVVIVIRADEAKHRDANHGFVDKIAASDHP